MEEGKLAKWHVKEGDTVKTGDILAEIETDKATMEFEAIDEGRVGKLLVPEGAEAVKVNTPIAVLLGEGESADAAPSGDIPSAMKAIREALVPDASAKPAPAKETPAQFLRLPLRNPTVPASSLLLWRGASRNIPASRFRRFKARVRADASSKPTSKRRSKLEYLPPMRGKVARRAGRGEKHQSRQAPLLSRRFPMRACSTRKATTRSSRMIPCEGRSPSA